MSANHSQSAFTLIELLIAIAIGAIVSLIITSTFQSVLIGGMRADEVVENQFSARNTLTLMSNDIESAGFLFSGTGGANSCHSIITYQGGNFLTIFPVVASEQAPPAYVSSASEPTMSITLTYNNAHGNDANFGQTNFVTYVNNLSNTDLVLSNPNEFAVNQVDLLTIPGIDVCIRLQITNIGTNNIVHGGASTLNPPGGITAFDPYLPRSINVNELRHGKIQAISGDNDNDGLQRVTYSIRELDGTPTLFRTVVNSKGVVLADAAIAQNVVYIRAKFAPLKDDGSIDDFVTWDDIVADNNQARISAVQLAIVVQSKDVGNRRRGAGDLNVLDAVYPTTDGFEYSVYEKTIYLNNAFWNQS